MSLIKRWMEREEMRQNTAEEIAVQSDALTRCEFHGEVFDEGLGDYTAAYKLANYQFSRGQLRGIFPNRRELTDEIQDVVRNAATECGTCAKWLND